MYPIWYQALLHRVCYPVVATGMAALWSVRTWGFDNVPRCGGLLVIANHQSFLDPVLVGMAVRRRLTYLARKTLFGNPVFDWLMQSFGAIPIDQDKPSAEGIRTALELLKQQEAVVIFPEGERTPHGQMQELKPGVTLLVRRGQVPVLPVGIAGAYEVWPRHQRLPRLCPIWSRRPCRLTMGVATGAMKASASAVRVSADKPRRGIAVLIGRPVPFPELQGLSHEAMLARLTEVLRQLWRVAESRRLLCPETISVGEGVDRVGEDSGVRGDASAGVPAQ